MIDTELRVLTAPARSAHAEPAAGAEPMLVLHIEDNPADALLTQEHIRGVLPGTRFDTAVRLGEVTVERAAAASCAILDLSLPDATCLEALTALRAMSESLPIIVLTGFDDLDVALSALRFGADDYLIKNYADGFTLERAMRYAVERRRLWLELAAETAATTVATAAGIAAEAALNAQLLAVSEAAAADRHMASDSSDVLVGTHEVSVRIDEASGDYALKCQSCDWENDRGSDDLHTWSERSLDLALLYHVDFGGIASGIVAELPKAPRPAAVIAPPTVEESAYGPRLHAALLARPPVARRSFFKRWL